MMEMFSADPAFWMNMGLVAFMGVFLYFFIIRPQKNEDKKRVNFQDSLKKGDKVITIGGVYGTIVTLGEEKATLKIADGIDVEFSRAAISRFQDATKQQMTDKNA